MSRVLIALALLLLNSACVRRGAVSMSEPKVYSVDRSEAVLELVAERLEPQELGADNEKKRRGLRAESLEEKASAELLREELREMLRGDARAQRPEARLFLTRVEVNLDPAKQPWIQSLFRRLDLWHGKRDYTRHSLEARFTVPQIGEDPAAPLVQIYAAFPRMSRSGPLIDARRRVGGAALKGRGDGAVRAELEGARRVRFVFSPQQDGRRRSWLGRLLPFFGGARGRELVPGPRTVDLVILVTDVEALEKAVLAQSFYSNRRDMLIELASYKPSYSLELGPLKFGYVGREAGPALSPEEQIYENYGVVLARGGDSSRKIDGGTAASLANGRLTLPLAVSFAYVSEKRPDRGYGVPVRGDFPPRPARLQYKPEVVGDEVHELRIAQLSLKLENDRHSACLAVVDSQVDARDAISATPRARWGRGLSSASATAFRPAQLRRAEWRLLKLNAEGVLEELDCDITARDELGPSSDDFLDLRISPYPYASEQKDEVFYLRARIAGQAAWSAPLRYLGPRRSRPAPAAVASDEPK